MPKTLAAIKPNVATASVSTNASHWTAGSQIIAALGDPRPAALDTSEATVVTHSTRKYCMKATRRMSAL